MSEKKYNKNSLQGTVYVLLSAICFSLGGVLIKSIPWNSLSINMVRSVLSFIVIFTYQRTQGRKFVFNNMAAWSGFKFCHGIDICHGNKDDNRSKCNCTAVYRTGLSDFDRVDCIQTKTKKGRSFNLHSCVMWNFLLLF